MKRAALYMYQRTCGKPIALLISGKHIAGEIGADARRRPEAAGDGRPRAVGLHAQAPAPPLIVGVGALADGAVERHPQVTDIIHGRPVGVLVVIPCHPPAFGVCEIFVGAPVGIGIAQPRQFAALHGVEIAILQR